MFVAGRVDSVFLSMLLVSLLVFCFCFVTLDISCVSNGVDTVLYNKHNI